MATVIQLQQDIIDGADICAKAVSKIAQDAGGRGSAADEDSARMSSMAPSWAAACRDLCAAVATLQGAGAGVPIKAPAGTVPNLYP
jgi:hypothetical protein